MADWLFPKDEIPGVTSGSWDAESDPTWKLLLHTTEGGSYSGARSSYVNNRFAPNVTAGPDPERTNAVRAWQHLSLSSRSTTLDDDSGGIRPNRDYVIQVEIVGFCDPKWKMHWLYIHNWPTWYKQGVAKVLNQILAARPIPRRSTVTWVNYPASYGEGARQRLSVAAFDAYEGILGHQHACENDHGDPGDLSAFVKTYLLPAPPKPPAPTPVPLPEDPMANPARLVQAKGQDAVYAVTLSGAVHIKNPTHLTHLRESGQVAWPPMEITAAELAQLLEKE